MMKITLALLACAAVASAGIIHPAVMPTGWKVQSHLDISDAGTVDVMVPLRPTQDQRDMLAEIAYAVSDPKSEHYGQHLSMEEANAVTAPKPANLAAVVEWLSDNGRVDVEVLSGGNTVRASMPIASAMRVFSTTFHTLVEKAEAEPRTVRQAMAYLVPEHLEHVVEHVYGLHGLPLPREVGRAVVGAGTPPAATPAVIAQAYGVKGVTPSGSITNRQAVAEFQGQTMNVTDLATFFEMYVKNAKPGDDKVYKFHGEPKQGGEGIEALLDIENIMGLAPGLKTEFYEQLAMDFCSDLKNWTGLLLNDATAPTVHSISYGWQGNLTQLQCTDAKVQDIDLDYQKLAARGISIIFASGDSGSGYSPAPPPSAHCSQPPAGEAKNTKTLGTASRNLRFGNTNLKVLEEIMAQECCDIASEEMGTKAWTVAVVNQTNAGANGNAPPPPPPQIFYAECTLYSKVTGTKKQEGAFSGVPAKPPGPAPSDAKPLWPSWPASSPWITAVGATRFHDDVVSTAAEDAVSAEDHFGSGGGFSVMFEAPKYQKEDVAHYFKTVPASTLPDPSKATYPKGGRGTPDVAALGTGFPVVSDGRVMPGVGGTSASTPVFAAIVALLNEARQNEKKPALGFLNPFIYQNKEAFLDVTIGSDKVGRGGFPLPEGFNCTSGWDPVTGFGTPIFEKLLAAAKKA